jgi:hypothetical protein
VEAHGGTLATVPVDPGAAFLVSLPAEPAEPADASAGMPDGSWNVFDEMSQRHVV